MQNKYVGDVGDFGKYALLNALCCGEGIKPQLALGIVWYLVANDDRPGGKFTKYLGASSKSGRRLRTCDENLYEKLKAIVESGERSVARVASDRVLDAAKVFFTESPSLAKDRSGWLDRAVRRTSDCDVVFLDPDNGLRIEADSERARSRKHAYIDEVTEFAKGGRTVVVYHHLGRQGSGRQQIREWLRRLSSQCGVSSLPVALWYHRGTARIYFILPGSAHETIVRRRVDAFLAGPWGQGTKAHFTLEDR